MLQVECVPWYSPALPGKRALVGLLALDPELTRVCALRGFLKSIPVVALSAVFSEAGLSSAGRSLSPWLTWPCDLLGFVALSTFLRLNGLRLQTSEEDVVKEILALAAGERSEEELASWIAARVAPQAR